MYNGKKKHGGETGRLPSTGEISSSWNISQWLPAKRNGSSNRELLPFVAVD